MQHNKSRAEAVVGKATMPSMDHFMYTDYQKIYEPADDTYLLIDAIGADQEFLARLQPRICVELGPGSGAVSAFTSGLLQSLAVPNKQSLSPTEGPSSAFTVSVDAAGQQHRSSAAAAAGSAAQAAPTPPGTSSAAAAGAAGGCGLMLAVDINTDACEATAVTCASNGTAVEVVRSDKWGCLQQRLAGNVDVLIFNPPYVPTPDEEVGGVGIEAAWAGGLKGRRVLDQVLPSVGTLLAPNGVFYLIAVTENNPADIVRILDEQGFVGLVVAKRRAFNEALIVLKFRRRDAPGGARWTHEQFEKGFAPP